MKFTYENQGAITYLVCELEAADQLDTLTLGMLTNNHIAGFAPVLYTEMNGQRFLKYNISAKVTADQFFAGSMNKQRALTAFQNILNAICSADEYMIDINSFVVDSDRIYLNVSSCEVALICVPVIADKDINPEVATLFRKIMFTTQFDNTEDVSYITQLITCINSGAAFTVYGMKDLVAQLYSGAPVVSQYVPTPAVPHQIPAQPVQPAQLVQQPVVPASPFDSTISIDDMPAMLAQKEAQQAQPSVQIPVAPIQPAPQVPLQKNVVPPVQPANVVKPPVQNFGAQAPAAKPQQPVAPKAPGFAIPGQPMGQPPVSPVAPVKPAGPQKQPVAPKAPGFAIPGQPMGQPPVPPAVPVDPKKQPAKAAPEGDKKMSLFGLLSHYSKENAEIYKKQKEEEKARKAANSAKPAAQKAPQKAAQKPAQRPPQKPGQMPVTPPANIPGQRSPMGVNPVGVAPQQQYTQPQFQPPVRPVPVQNSFNETTVLSPAMMGGETTVLSANMAQPNPTLTRIKTGDVVSVNKPVFRIGKEKSYVDYFIGDNTAISRSHANIHTENGEYFIEDTNSTNHTYVNGKLINSNVKTKIVSGDKIKLANEDFTFSV